MTKMRFFFLFLGVSALLLAIFVQSPFAEISPLSSALHVLPPVGNDTGDVNALDKTLTDFLNISVCEITPQGTCTSVITFTSQSGTRITNRIRFLKDLYQVNWKLPFSRSFPRNQYSRKFEIRFTVADLELGSATYEGRNLRGFLQIKFRIDNHPVIRVRVLHRQGFTAINIAEALKTEFGLSGQETAQLLRGEGYGVLEIAQALRDAYSASAQEAAQIIKEIGYSEDEIILALMEVYDTYLAIVDVMVTDWVNFGNVPYDYTGLAWGGTCTIPYIPDLIGERVWSNDVNVGIGGTYTTVWVKYDLVLATSDQPVLADYGVFHWPYWEWWCPSDWQRANGTSSGRQGALTTGTEGDCYRNGLCVHYVPMNQTDNFITNVGLSYTSGSEAACPALGEANLGYWPMQADSYDIHKNCADDRWVYLCYGRGKAWPPMPISIDVTDEEKLNSLATYAPQVWIAQDESYWPSSVEWAFPHLVRFIPCTENPLFCGAGPEYDSYYWLRTVEGLDEPSDVLDFFRGCNGSSTSNPCTISDVPVYAFWAKKSVQVGENFFDFVDLVYFFYYPYNRGKEIIDTIFGNHVGDWEHVTVRLMWVYDDQTGWSLQPVQMYISAHDFGGIYEWDQITKFEGTSPIVYSAWGSHGVWLTAGRHRYDEVCHPWPWCEDLVDWTSEGTAWDTWNYLEAFDYNAKKGLGGSIWPMWMSANFADPGICDPSNPACGPIYRWGNMRRGSVLGYYRLEDGPTGPVSKGVWSPGILK